ncbi:MAG: DUF1735 domain-containing protein [Bacteroidales bacterium]|nr:DUF1735 domain-containing protein [Bacteroidales bacterium]
MKKFIAFIILSVAAVSCYEDYILDYVYTGIYFPYQIDVRTFVVGEGMKVKVGAALGGVRKNTVDREVTFTIDPALVTPAILAQMKGSSYSHIKDPTTPVATLQVMPANYYTLSNNSKMIIKAGEHMGDVVVKPDSANFLNDSVNTIYATYVLPFYIQDADADTVLENKRYNIVGLKFENMLYGNYWHGGQARIERPGFPDSIFTYKTEIPTAEAKIWILKTAGPSTLYCNGYLNQTTAKKEMTLVLKGNTVFVSAGVGATYTIEPDGQSTFNRSKLLQDRRIYLKYKYLNPGNGWTYHCTDTLRFRNRFRDGINEWMDENPANYN